MRKEQPWHKQLSKIAIQWVPAIFAGLLLFFVPPVGIAIIAAYFTAPVLTAIREITKLPLTLSTLFVMASMLFIAASFSYIFYHGLMDIVPILERHLKPFTGNMDVAGKVFTFLEGRIVEYGHALSEHLIAFVSAFFQRIFSLFIFLIAYFFALRESGKNRFWFLIYFPAPIRKPARRMFAKAGELIGTFLFVEARLFFITFIIVSTGFSLLQFDSPIGTAFLISLLDSLPLLGIGLFLLPMAVFFFYTKQIVLAISLLSIYLLVVIIRQIAESYMWASTFKVKPIHAFFITICSFYLFGLPGILLTPFLLFAALKAQKHPLFTG